LLHSVAGSYPHHHGHQHHHSHHNHDHHSAPASRILDLPSQLTRRLVSSLGGGSDKSRSGGGSGGSLHQHEENGAGEKPKPASLRAATSALMGLVLHSGACGCFGVALRQGQCLQLSAGFLSKSV
jgi:hypothetical protein